MLIVAPLAVAMVAFILYAIDRKSKSEPISWENAGKLSMFGCLLTAGLVFSLTPELNIPEAVAIAQDMFVGKPTF